MIYRVTLNGKIYEVEVEKGEAVIKSEFDAAAVSVAPVQEAALVVSAAPQASAPAAASGSAITAPMPGNINAIKVTSGQSVKEGDVLIILEAMKMENEITASRAGKIGKIFVQKGATVETGTPLIEVL